MSEDYFLNRRVIISPYDKNWSVMFEREKRLILSVIQEKNVLIEHIGSTAIFGLSAKPIIDIMIGTKDLNVANKCIKPLENIDYEYVPFLEESFPERRFLHKGPNLPNKHFHLHILVIDSDFWKRQLMFRDYLRKHSTALIDYQNLKERLAKQYQNDVFGYCEAKTEFIQNILKLAKKEMVS